MESPLHTSIRRCLREPVPEIAEAARLLDAAVTAHLNGDRERTESFLRQADMPAVRAWTESLWGRNSQYALRGSSPKPIEHDGRANERMPRADLRRELHARDGYHCRFCGIPVIRKEIRQRFCSLYSNLTLWGRKNIDQHAAFQAMWAQYDHVVPHWRGGGNGLQNLVVTCAPCNYARMGYTLEEAHIANPFDRQPLKATWDGLERLLKSARP
jgi:hypothetical protein